MISVYTRPPRSKMPKTGCFSLARPRFRGPATPRGRAVREEAFVHLHRPEHPFLLRELMGFDPASKKAVVAVDGVATNPHGLGRLDRRQVAREGVHDFSLMVADQPILLIHLSNFYRSIDCQEPHQATAYPLQVVQRACDNSRHRNRWNEVAMTFTPLHDPYLPDREGARLFGFSVSTFWRRVADGTTPHRREDRRLPPVAAL